MGKSPNYSTNQTFKSNYLVFADFYAGIGGFRLGLESIGWQCVFSNENNPDCIKTYNRNFDDFIESCDIEDLIPSDKLSCV